MKRYLNIRNTVRAALALVVFVVVIVSLRRLVGDVPTWLGVVLMGTVYTLAFTIRAGSHSEPSNT